MSRSLTNNDRVSQRALFSRFHALLDTETLLIDTIRLPARLAQRKVTLLSTRRHRQEYVSDDVLGEIARALEPEEMALKGRDRRLREMLDEVREELGRFWKEQGPEGTEYLRCDSPKDGWSARARDRSMALGLLAVLLFGLAPGMLVVLLLELAWLIATAPSVLCSSRKILTTPRSLLMLPSRGCAL